MSEETDLELSFENKISFMELLNQRLNHFKLKKRELKREVEYFIEDDLSDYLENKRWSFAELDFDSSPGGRLHSVVFVKESTTDFNPVVNKNRLQRLFEDVPYLDESDFYVEGGHPDLLSVGVRLKPKRLDEEFDTCD